MCVLKPRMPWSVMACSAWPLLKDVFTVDQAWLVRCSILSAYAEQQEIDLSWLYELARLAIKDADGTVRSAAPRFWVGLCGKRRRLSWSGDSRSLLQSLQQDGDHRVVAAALNGLQT